MIFSSSSKDCNKNINHKDNGVFLVLNQAQNVRKITILINGWYSTAGTELVLTTICIFQLHLCGHASLNILFIRRGISKDMLFVFYIVIFVRYCRPWGYNYENIILQVLRGMSEQLIIIGEKLLLLAVLCSYTI